MEKQLHFNLEPENPHSLEYFVPHSGALTATQALEDVLYEVREGPEIFFPIFIYGPEGSGKTHLANAYADLMKTAVPEDRIRIFDVDEVCASNDDWVRLFISEYQDFNTNGGVFFVLSKQSPRETTDNPHVQSRLLAGRVLELSYPVESELRPVLQSLCERRNMRLSDFTIDYLLKRLPREPLSFAELFAKISELSLSEKRPAGLGLIREIMNK